MGCNPEHGVEGTDARGATDTASTQGHWLRVAAAGDCPNGKLLGVEVDGDPVVIANVDGTYYALEDVCSHQDYPLSDGELEGTELECIFHGATFDVCSGKATRLPAIRPVKTYQIEDRDGELFVLAG